MREVRRVIRGLYKESTKLLDLIPVYSRIEILYMLPKIHKLGNTKGLIISQNKISG